MCFSGCNNTMCTFAKKTKFVAGSFHCFVRHFLNVHLYTQHYKDVMTLDYEISWTRFCELFAFLDVEVNELLSGYLMGSTNESDNWPISKTSSICIQCALVTFANFFFFCQPSMHLSVCFLKLVLLSCSYAIGFSRQHELGALSAPKYFSLYSRR